VHPRPVRAFALALLAVTVAAGLASAARPLPMYVIAAARLDAANLAPGKTVQAFCDGYLAGQGSAFAYQGLSYVALDVQGDDPEAAGRDGCREGERVCFTAGGFFAAEHTIWHEGSSLGSWAAPFSLTASSAPAAPIPPALAIARDGTNVRLTWQHTAPNTAYQLWQGTTPYFNPGGPKTALLAAPAAPNPCGTLSQTTPAAFGDPNANTFYLVYISGGNDAWAVSNRTGVFSFAIQPGN